MAFPQFYLRIPGVYPHPNQLASSSSETPSECSRIPPQLGPQSQESHNPLQHSKHSKASQAQHAAQLPPHHQQPFITLPTAYLLTTRSKSPRLFRRHAWTWSWVLWVSVGEGILASASSIRLREEKRKSEGRRVLERRREVRQGEVKARAKGEEMLYRDCKIRRPEAPASHHLAR